MAESGRHPELWRQLYREVIRDLEAELERLRARESDLEQSAREREVVLLELIEVERASRPPAATGAATDDPPDETPRSGTRPRSVPASARAAELLARLSLSDSRIPELESALRARDEELRLMRNRKVFRAVDVLVRLRRRVLGQK